MKRLKGKFLIALGLSLMWVSPVIAISLDIEPSMQTVGLGSFNVDVVISGLNAAGEIVSAFDLDVAYDDSMLSATDVTFGSFLGDPLAFEAFTNVDLTTPGIVDFAELSLLFDFELASIQPDTFTLATLTFEATAFGTSSLIFSDGFDDIKGRSIFDGSNFIPAILQIDSVGTANVSAVPEPGTILLLGSGLVGLAGVVKRRKSKTI